MDACMEVDGRVGKRRGNICIKKDQHGQAGYTTTISDYCLAKYFYHYLVIRDIFLDSNREIWVFR